MPKLTKNYIDKITAPADKEAFHWDSEVKGFGLRVTPSGKITYIVQGRVNGSSPRISIGPHGVFTVDQAREVVAKLADQPAYSLTLTKRHINAVAEEAGSTAHSFWESEILLGAMRDQDSRDTTKRYIERRVR